MWSVIVRELRSASRAPFTYWLRLLGAGAVCAAALSEIAMGEDQGDHLFQALSVTISFAIWLLVPLITADCLSRERREGTLGLLFLTPLTPVQIVVAKLLIQTLRAFSLALAILPVLVLPVLIGGVNPYDLGGSLLINGASFCWALGAGIWISSRSVKFHRAVLGTMALAAVFFLLNLYLVLHSFRGRARGSRLLF